MNRSLLWSRIAVLPKLLVRLVCQFAAPGGIAELIAMDDRHLADIGLKPATGRVHGQVWLMAYNKAN